jgi:hypothetical protein
MATNNASYGRDGGDLKPQDCLKVLEAFSERLNTQQHELRDIQAGIGELISGLKRQTTGPHIMFEQRNILNEVRRRGTICLIQYNRKHVNFLVLWTRFFFFFFCQLRLSVASNIHTDLVRERSRTRPKPSQNNKDYPPPNYAISREASSQHLMSVASVKEISLELMDEAVQEAILEETRKSKAAEISRTMSRRRSSDTVPPGRSLSIRRASLEPCINPIRGSGPDAFHSFSRRPSLSRGFVTPRGRSNRQSTEDTTTHDNNRQFSTGYQSEVKGNGSSHAIPQAVISIPDEMDDDEQEGGVFGTNAMGEREKVSDEDGSPSICTGPTNPLLGLCLYSSQNDGNCQTFLLSVLRFL